jgi:hypothetical protein
MNYMIMKRKILTLVLVTILIVACNIPSLGTPASPTATAVALATSTTDTGGVVTFNNVSFTVPLGVAKDAAAETVPASDANGAPWEIAPAHLQFTLTDYQLQNKFHEPQIYVYPAAEYAQLNSIAAEQIQRVRNVLAGSTLPSDGLPSVPTFNAAPLIASNVQVIDFKGGRGIRMVTQYDQYPAPINNHELFYHFQGLTTDEKYYVIAILPVTASILAEDEKPESPVPAGGVPIPTATGPDQPYYESVTKALDAMYPDSFNPSLFQLDALIQSITVTS